MSKKQPNRAEITQNKKKKDGNVVQYHIRNIFIPSMQVMTIISPAKPTFLRLYVPVTIH